MLDVPCVPPRPGVPCLVVTDAAAIFLNGVAAGASRKLNRPFLGLSTSDSTCGDHAGKNGPHRRLPKRLRDVTSLTHKHWVCLEYCNAHHRSFAKRPQRVEKQGRRLRVGSSAALAVEIMSMSPLARANFSLMYFRIGKFM
jgi:hypothetical protein